MDQHRKKKILIAMNSFKGSLAALEACKSVREGVFRADPTAEVESLPLVDGGTGSLEAWAAVMKAVPGQVSSVDAHGCPLRASVLKTGDTAYLEMATASGLHLLDPDGLDIMSATTFGTGLLLKHALDAGAGKIYLGIGGSATHDLGTGILRALGVRFLDCTGKELSTPRELLNLKVVDMSGLDARIPDTELIILCDVDNPLLGKRGAAATYAPQKGAVTAELLEKCEKLSETFTEYYSASGLVIGNEPGDGAAGGIPALLRPLLGAKVQSGADFTLSLADFRRKAEQADLIITGEGQFDEQSFYGKGPGAVIDMGRMLGKPVLILTGGYRNLPARMDGCAIFSIMPRPASLPDAIDNAANWLSEQAYNCIKLYMM